MEASIEEEEKKAAIVIQFVKENCGLDVVNEQREQSEISSDF